MTGAQLYELYRVLDELYSEQDRVHKQDLLRRAREAGLGQEVESWIEELRDIEYTKLRLLDLLGRFVSGRAA